jgi:hypothetical protein
VFVSLYGKIFVADYSAGVPGLVPCPLLPGHEQSPGAGGGGGPQEKQQTFMQNLSYRIIRIKVPGTATNMCRNDSLAQCCGSMLFIIRLFSLPGHPGSASKNLSILTQKNGF